MVVYYGKAAPVSGSSGGGSGDAVWGSITGTLSDQTDLANALANKQDVIDSTHKLSASLVDGLATVATTGAYSDLSGTPDLSAYVTTDTAQNITATKTFTHSSQNIIIKGGTASGAKYGISYYKSDTEKAFLQYRNNDINSKDFLCTGNFGEESYLGFRNSGTTNAHYNLLTPLGSDAKTPFNLTNTFKDFYLPLGVTDGTTMVTTASSGVLDISPLIPTYSAFGGATGSVAGSAGLVPAPAATDNDKYLKGDGTWAAVSGGGLENTATGTNSLTILGTAATGSSSCNIGKSSSTSTHNYCTAVGLNAICSNNWGVAIGAMASAGGTSSIAIGGYASATGQHSIHIGEGTNSTDYTLSIGFNSVQGKTYTLLDGNTGKIPNDRINGVSGSFTSQDGKTVTVTNGVITSIV